MLGKIQSKLREFRKNRSIAPAREADEPGLGRRFASRFPKSLLAYAALTLVMTYPAVLHLHDQVLGSNQDAWIFWWNNWWVKEALTTGQNVYFTRRLFFPYGADLTYHSFSWLNTALWLALEPFLGTIAAYNLTVLWVFPLAGWGMERLVRDLTGSGAAAFVAGLVYAFVPYRLGQYNHLTLMGTQWMPFYTLYLLRAARDGRWRNILLAGLFLVLTALVGWNLFIYLAIWTAWIAGCLWLKRAAGIRRLVRVSALVFLFAGLVLSPLLVPMLTTGRFGAQDTLGSAEQTEIKQGRMQTDLLAYILPNKFHPLWGRAAAPMYDRLGGRNEPRRVVYLGYTVMALLGYGLLRSSVRRRAMWWGGMLLWWSLSLGSFLKFEGHMYRGMPLPHYFLNQLYVFKLLKIPDRFNLMLSLPAAVMVGYAVADFVTRKRKLRLAFPALVSLLLLFEYLGIPVDMHELQISPFYEDLAREEEAFGIVELPIDFHRTAKRYMLYQSVHGHPIVEGHISRRSAEAVAFLEAHPLLRGIHQEGEIDPRLADVSRQLRTLREAGFRYVIIHKQFIDLGRAARWRDYLTITPRYEDDDLVVFTTDPQPGVDFRLRAAPGRGLGIVEGVVAPGSLPPGEKMSVVLHWGAAERIERDFLARLGLVNARGEAEQQWTAPIAEGWPTSQWRAGDLAIAVYPLTLRDSLPAGRYTVTVALEDLADGAVSPRLAIDTVQVYESDLEAGRVYERDYQLGERVQLRRVILAAEILEPGDTLKAVLVWGSDGEVEQSYKVFCHLLSAEGKLVAQRDGVPRGGIRPTSSWRAGEIIEDSCEISLGDDLPPGDYELSVGMYDAASMERLPVRDLASERLLDGRITLGSVRIVAPGQEDE